jgi:hypothetical protein
MILLLFICSTLPILYFVFYAFKRKINYIAVFAGVLVRSLSNICTGYPSEHFASGRENAANRPDPYYVFQALIIGIVNASGIFSF